MSDHGLKVARAVSGGIAAQLGITKGARVRAVNGKPVRDLLDYRFLIAADTVELLVETGGDAFLFDIEKDPDEPLGIDFESPFPDLMKCGNRCLFCFVDQMPPGMRRSLYIKDDDYRLSFWDGNFITLTNLDRTDWERIVTQRLSPLYISVHTTNPALRRKMMGNRRAGEIREQMRFLAGHGIKLHTQIVLCPGLNDGPELERTLDDLGALAPAVRSIAVVPVGRTRYRDGLYAVGAFTARAARAVIAAVRRRQDLFREALGSPLVYAGDEFYVKGGVTVPAAEHYAGFPQLENGVGLVRLFLDEWETVRRGLAYLPPLRVTLATGEMGKSVLVPLVERLNRDTGARITVVPVRNHFFGTDVTAAGLLTGGDLRAAFKRRDCGDLVIIPAVALKEHSVFLDDVTLDDLRKDLGAEVAAAAGPRELMGIIKNH